MRRPAAQVGREAAEEANLREQEVKRQLAGNHRGTGGRDSRLRGCHIAGAGAGAGAGSSSCAVILCTLRGGWGRGLRTNEPQQQLHAAVLHKQPAVETTRGSRVVGFGSLAGGHSVSECAEA